MCSVIFTPDVLMSTVFQAISVNVTTHQDGWNDPFFPQKHEVHSLCPSHQLDSCMNGKIQSQKLEASPRQNSYSRTTFLWASQEVLVIHNPWVSHPFVQLFDNMMEVFPERGESESESSNDNILPYLHTDIIYSTIYCTYIIETKTWWSGCFQVPSLKSSSLCVWQLPIKTSTFWCRPVLTSP